MGMTCKLCVIDDVKSVVDGISRYIPWHEHGIEVAGTALDGEEGLELVRDKKPDIILTDIRMPNLDGIEMLQKLREEAYEGKVIFFSGYNDFEYAQEAIRLGAFDYIMKPHSVDQIVGVVLKAKDEIEARRREERRMLDIQSKLKESLPMLRQEFFNLLIRHRANEQTIRNQWQFLHIDLEQSDLALLVIEIDRLEEQCLSLSIEQVELIRFSLQNIVEETIGAYTKGYIFRETMSRFVAIYYEPEAYIDLRIAERCCEHIEAYTKFTVTIGKSRQGKHAAELGEAYREAVFALSYQFYAGGNVVLLYDDVAGSDKTLPAYSQGLEQELTMSLRSGNAAKAEEALGRIFGELASGPVLPDPMSLVSVYYELASQMVKILLEKIDYSEIQTLEQNLRDRQWLLAVPLKELQRLLLDLCRQGCTAIENRQRSDSERTVEKAIEFVRSRLHTDLSVGECAKHVHVSSNYFIHLFKKVTGLTFVQYVTQERMEKAKKMLLDQKQVQEIAAEVGYEDRRYFSEVFKKTVGMTPSEYKDSYLKGNARQA